MPDFNQIKQMIWGSAQKISGKDLLKHGDMVINKITDLKDDSLPIFLL